MDFTTLHQHLTTLATRCDGAAAQDHQGFSRFDTATGKALAATSPGQWTEQNVRTACQLVWKYRKQLGLKDTQVPTVPTGLLLDVHATLFALQFPYDQQDTKGRTGQTLGTMTRALPSRRWNGAAKIWEGPLSRENCGALLALVAAFDLVLSDDSMQRLADGATAQPTPTPAAPAPVVNPRRLICAPNSLYVAFPYDAALVSAVKNLPVRGAFAPSTKTWQFPKTDAVARTLLAFGEKHGFDTTAVQTWLAQADAEARQAQDAAAQAVSARMAHVGPLDAPLPSGRVLFPFQHTGVEFLVSQERALLADGMGCLTGDAIVQVLRNGASRKMTLRTVAQRFPRWQGETRVRALADGEFRQCVVRQVLNKGIRPVVKITLASGKTLRLTPDHELAQPGELWTRADALCVGDTVLTNGTAADAPAQETSGRRSTATCPGCGTTQGLITYPYAKFVGWCRTCMYRTQRTKPSFVTGKSVDDDGYVRVSGQQAHPRANLSGQVYEHILVMEQHLGRFIVWPEQVHHKDHNRQNNALGNLELLTPAEHHRAHRKHHHLHGSIGAKGGKVCFIPQCDTVVSVTPDGEDHVYDLVMADPYRNFVANGIVVANCGKTTQALVAAKAYPGHAILVLAPVSLRTNWLREAEACGTPIEVHSHAKIPTPLEERPYVVIADECHAFQSLNAQRTKKFLALAAGASAVWCLSGTPIKNGRPANLFPLLVAIKHPLAQDKKYFETRYCAAKATRWSRWDVTGAAHLDELHKRLGASLIRRTKAQVLKDLPAKTRTLVEVEPSPDELAVYRATLAQLRAEYKARVKAGEIMREGEALVMLGHLRKCGSAAKLSSAVTLAEDILEEGGSVVLFTEYRETVEHLAKALAEYGVVTLTGETPQQMRQLLIDAFQSGQARVFVGTIRAGGVGITLTAASHVILVDRPWVPGDAEQSEDRCHRIGQHNPVTAHWLQLPDGTGLDVQIDQLLLAKQERIDLVLTGKRKTLRGVQSLGEVAGDLLAGFLA